MSLSTEVEKLEEQLDDAEDDISELEGKIRKLEEELDEPKHCAICQKLIDLRK